MFAIAHLVEVTISFTQNKNQSNCIKTNTKLKIQLQPSNLITNNTVHAKLSGSGHLAKLYLYVINERSVIDNQTHLLP